MGSLRSGADTLALSLSQSAPVLLYKAFNSSARLLCIFPTLLSQTRSLPAPWDVEEASPTLSLYFITVIGPSLLHVEPLFCLVIIDTFSNTLHLYLYHTYIREAEWHHSWMVMLLLHVFALRSDPVDSGLCYRLRHNSCFQAYQDGRFDASRQCTFVSVTAESRHVMCADLG